MRVIILAALCFSMVVIAVANDVVFGERQEGDFHVASRRLFRPDDPDEPPSISPRWKLTYRELPNAMRFSRVLVVAKRIQRIRVASGNGRLMISNRATERSQHPVPGKPMVAQTGFNTQGVITSVTVVNAPGSDAKVSLVKGGPGYDSVVLTAISSPGMGLDAQVDIYATQPGKENSDGAASS